MLRIFPSLQTFYPQIWTVKQQFVTGNGFKNKQTQYVTFTQSIVAIKLVTKKENTLSTLRQSQEKDYIKSLILCLSLLGLHHFLCQVLVHEHLNLSLICAFFIWNVRVCLLWEMIKLQHYANSWLGNQFKNMHNIHMTRKTRKGDFFLVIHFYF